jgi:Domain of unknown function (DUF4034)
MRFLVLPFLLATALLPAALHSQVTTPVPQEQPEQPPRDGMGNNHVRTALINEKFDDLDRFADLFRREKTRVNGGEWRLRQFYVALDAPQLTDKDTIDHLAHLQKWIDTRPESITARVAMATSLTRWAWVARGSGYANTVTPEGWRLFDERIAKARQVLEGAANMRTMCPQWYSEMMTVGLASSWNDRQVKDIFERGIQFEPDYYYLYDQYANYLLPKWDGKPGDAAKFAKASADRIGGDDGDLIYYHIARAIIRRNEDANARPRDVDWQRIQRGYQVIGSRYGVTRGNENELAFLAYMYRDAAVAKAQFALIGDNWSKGVWNTKKYFDRARDWAQGRSGADAN